MADKHETITDIIAEMRALSNPISDGIIAINGRSIADRLEAAWKREKSAIEANALAAGGIVEASRKQKPTTEKSSVVGDAAKLREALVKVKAIIDIVPFPMEYYCRLEPQEVAEAVGIIDSALSAPARNCDRFATLEDARKEHHKICEEYGACNKACGYKSGHSGTYQCFEAWLFAPATEQKGENNANK